MQNQVVLKSFLDFLRTHLDGFSQCSHKVQFHLADLAFQVGKKRYRHNRHEGYAFLPYQDIHRKLGRNFLKTTNKTLDFFETIEDWSKKEKSTRGIRLSPKLSVLKAEFLEKKT